MLNKLMRPGGRASDGSDLAAWDADRHASTYDDDLANTVALSVNASEAMAAAARITGDVRGISDVLEKMAAAVIQLERSVDMIATNSTETATRMTSARDTTKTSSQRMHETVEVARSSVDSLARTGDETAALLTAVDEVKGFVTSIGEIAGKTSMLAINASIEAARAGEAGRGFAVVAAQVQSLSNQTRQVTDDIARIIGGLSGTVGRLSEAVEQATGDVDRAAAFAEQSAGELDEVSRDLDLSVDSVREIEAALSEQSIAAVSLTVNLNSISSDSQAAATRTDDLIRAIGASEALIEQRLAQLDGRPIQDYVLHRAKSDHFLWKKRLSEMLVGLNSLTERELADHHSCRLGKWYDAVEDASIRNHPAYAALVKPHEGVHRHGKEAARLFAQGDIEGAVEEVEQMNAQSIEVVRLLDELLAR